MPRQRVPIPRLPCCEHCASANVRWFTPTQYAACLPAVLLCLRCRRVSILSPDLVSPGLPRAPEVVLEAAAVLA